MNVYISGLTDERLNSALFLLRKHPPICQSLKSSVQLVEMMARLITKEMESIQKDIMYWTSLHRSGPLVIHVSQSYISFYRKLRRLIYFNIFNQQTPVEAVPLLVEDDIEQHKIALTFKLDYLARLLASIYEAASYLNLLCVDISQANQAVILNPVAPRFTGIVEDAAVVLESSLLARKYITQCLNKIEGNFSSAVVKPSITRSISSIQEFIFSHLHSPRPSSFSSAKLQQGPQSNSTTNYGTTSVKSHDSSGDGAFVEQDDLTDTLARVEELTGSILIRGYGYRLYDENYPLGVTDPHTRRPTDFESYWLYNAVLCMAGCVLGNTAFNMYRDGSLVVLVKNILEAFAAATMEHIVNPINNLCHELFESISRRKDERIVSEHDLAQSQEALQRMLEDFAKSSKRLGVLPELHWNSSPAVPSRTQAYGAEGATSGGGSESHTQEKLNPLSSEAVMEALMKTYENEMKTPITGIVFGSLMTTMLIQMQKLKVHTESALLTMDKVLTSNQLTMAGTAAMPAMLFFGAIGYALRGWFFRTVSLSGRSFIELRRTMCDVERALGRVYCASQFPPNAAHRETAGLYPAYLNFFTLVFMTHCSPMLKPSAAAEAGVGTTETIPSSPSVYSSPPRQRSFPFGTHEDKDIAAVIELADRNHGSPTQRSLQSPASASSSSSALYLSPHTARLEHAAYKIAALNARNQIGIRQGAGKPEDLLTSFDHDAAEKDHHARLSSRGRGDTIEDETSIDSLDMDTALSDREYVPHEVEKSAARDGEEEEAEGNTEDSYAVSYDTDKMNNPQVHDAEVNPDPHVSNDGSYQDTHNVTTSIPGSNDSGGSYLSLVCDAEAKEAIPLHTSDSYLASTGEGRVEGRNRDSTNPETTKALSTPSVSAPACMSVLGDVDRGMLYFHLFNLRSRLEQMHQEGFWRYSSPSLSQSSLFHYMWQMFSGVTIGTLGWLLYGSQYRKRFYAVHPEYLSILTDLAELVAPDLEVNGSRKLHTANRMRSSHRCFVPNNGV